MSLLHSLHMCHDCIMARAESAARIADISARQWGLVTARQAAAEGVTASDLHRLAADRLLEPVARGVYYLRGGSVPTLLELRAAWLQLQPAKEAEERSEADGVVSYTSAAVAHGVGVFLGDTHEFTVPARKQTRRKDVVLHVSVVTPKEVVWLDGLPVTSIPRTVADLLDWPHSGDHVARVAFDALHRGLTTREELAAALGPVAPRVGHPVGDGEGALEYLRALTGEAFPAGSVTA